MRRDRLAPWAAECLWAILPYERRFQSGAKSIPIPTKTKGVMKST